ncbi:platelet-activating factor acetylhydrolase IB subunit [Paraglaciecola aquimarina]|uniref:Platelet-activating factor acetylhydrolase IB subunit n=1 Tax=Paraglaciecola aquimarina TaxID=1235557 RepID=A0ABU3SW54_9ALTE|nr:platelet-activating factor acetylhydrolase IB subunit [Paraglaciecola aquimarina]MDU0354234.1 platelet-activating factor acetylhydrolase IB subunit [Paraglaciecola aquimarina]
MKNIILVACLLLASCTTPVDGPLSIKPHIQTDEWAVKWWMPRHQQKLIEKEQMASVDLLFLGDSITHAWENKGKEVWRQYYAKRQALNIGFSGDRTENVLWRLENGEVEGIDPKLVVLMIGTNNTGHRQDAPMDTALGIKRILETLEKKLPNSKVLLLAIFPRGASANDPLRKINDDINHIIKNYHDGDRVHYLDINHIFLDQNGNLSQAVMKDLLHPNAEQYEVWAQAMEPSINTLMASKH